MFDSASSGYKRMGGRHGGGCSRNVSFFGILVVLALIFSVFYLYISASNEVSTLRTELSSQSDYVAKLKNDLLASNAKVEKLTAAEGSCSEAKSTVDQQLDDCNANAKKLKESLDTQQQSTAELETLRNKNAELTTALTAQTANMTAMQMVGVGREAIVVKMNETIDTLRRDLILKDELIKKLEADAASAKGEKAPDNAKTEEVHVANPLTNEPAIARDDGEVSHHPNPAESLQQPPDHPGDRVKMEEAAQQENPNNELLQAAVAPQPPQPVTAEADLRLKTEN